jgi:hypothetical protein
VTTPWSLVCTREARRMAWSIGFGFHDAWTRSYTCTCRQRDWRSPAPGGYGSVLILTKDDECIFSLLYACSKTAPTCSRFMGSVFLTLFVLFMFISFSYPPFPCPLVSPSASITNAYPTPQSDRTVHSPLHCQTRTAPSISSPDT